MPLYESKWKKEDQPRSDDCSSETLQADAFFLLWKRVSGDAAPWGGQCEDVAPQRRRSLYDASMTDGTGLGEQRGRGTAGLHRPGAQMQRCSCCKHTPKKTKRGSEAIRTEQVERDPEEDSYAWSHPPAFLLSRLHWVLFGKTREWLETGLNSQTTPKRKVNPRK